MRLSWNEVRVRAAAFAKKWRDAEYEKGETQSFYDDFFRVFGVERHSVARYEEHVQKLDDRSGFIDLFWPSKLIVEQKSAGRDLDKAYGQAGEYFDALPEKERPRYILVSDFRTFELHALGERTVTRFDLQDLPAHVESFGFILDVERRVFRDQDPANLEAAELVGRVHDALATAGYGGHDLERFLVRLVFCLFADDTGIFEPRDILFDLLESRTGEDGADFGLWLSQLFQVLNTPPDARQATLDEDLGRFPYVNGDLFDGPLTIPSFDASMRRAVLDACGFDWSRISPAIFGALFQSVMAPAERRAQGAHYTTEKNILKVIEPLFLDDLRAEFKRLQARRDGRRRADLRRFQRKLGGLTFFDPACGCGNFLIIAYRELRRLELDVLKELYAGPMLETLADRMSLIDVDQFHGIELGEFPVRIAETALWMMDHIMNNELSLEFGRTYTRIPLQNAPTIVHGDALEMDWNEVLPSWRCDFVLGNPPFVGAKFQTTEQRAQVRRIADLGKSGGTLDYVTAWFLRAGEYVRGAEIPRDASDGPFDEAPTPDAGAQRKQARIGFVATNSITQGEQVAQFWPLIFDRLGLEVAFAHRTFAWGSDARGMAHVHVVIIGLTGAEDAPTHRRLFSYPDLKGDAEESLHAVISPYLFDAGGLANPHLVVRETAQPLNGWPRLASGSQPIDKGHYIFKADERAAFLESEPAAAKFLRPYVGAREYLQGHRRWILALQDAEPGELASMPSVVRRMQAVKAYRARSKRKSTLALADYPQRYNVEVLPTAPFLAVPEVSSERREYVPIGWLEPPTIPSNKVRIAEGATKPLFALLTSAMHMAWLRQIGGRLESRYSYGIGIVYNTFPPPPAEPEALERLTPLADAVLSARNAHPGATLAQLYDPDLMPVDLRRAHQAIDRAVDRLYRRRRFQTESERLEHLLGLYERMQTPIVVEAARGFRRRRRPTTRR